MSKTVRVTAPYVTLKINDPINGTVVLGFYEGALVEHVDDVSAKHHVDGGQAEYADADDMPMGPPLPDAASTTEEPAGNASLDDWQAYARGQGATDEDLEGLSRNDLRDQYGSTES